MAFASGAAFVASLFLARWAALMAAVRGLSAQRLALESSLHQKGRLDPNVLETLDVLEVETNMDFKRAQLLRYALLCAFSGVALCLTCALLEGMVVFELRVRRFVQPLLLFSVIVVSVAICLGGWEMLLSVDPEKHRSRRVFLLKEMQAARSPTTK